jgi:hypothetical protein
VNTLDDEAEDGRIVALQSLSNAQLIQILQHHDGNDDLTQMVERRTHQTQDGRCSAAMKSACWLRRD